MNPVTLKTYTGVIKLEQRGQNDYALVFEGGGAPLSETIEEDIESHGSFLCVRYFLSDCRKTLDELETGLLKHLDGAGEATYRDHFTEITGYIGTTENLNVGGHDLLNELTMATGKPYPVWLYLEILYSKTGIAPDPFTKAMHRAVLREKEKANATQS